MSRPTRRDFLRRGTCAGLALAAGKGLTGCGLPSTPAMLPLPLISPIGSPARVAAVLGSDLYGMTQELLQTLGGIDAIVHPGETVFIKPNFGSVGFVSQSTIVDGECTKPEIVIAVTEACLQAGAAEVIIGEAGQVPKFSWEDDVRTLDGSTSMAAEAARLDSAYAGKVTLACLNTDSPSWDMIPSPYSGLEEISVSSLVKRADRLISIPVLKTHRWTHITGGIKNLLGVTPVAKYGNGMPWRFGIHDAPGGLSQCLADIAVVLKPDLTIIDGSIGCEGNGPNVMPEWWGSTVDVKDRLGDWVLLASTDVVAADATMARMIGQEVTEVEHLWMAYNQGLGQAREDLIEVVGASLADLRIDWQPPEYTEGFSDTLLPGIMLMFGG